MAALVGVAEPAEVELVEHTKAERIEAVGHIEVTGSILVVVAVGDRACTATVAER